MTTRNKILLSVGAVCLVAVIAVVAVVAVFAARTQTVNSTIKVSYTAREVVGSVSANYYVGNGTAKPMDDNGKEENGSTQIAFNAGAADVNGSLSPTEDIVLNDLDENKLYVIFEYIFVNTGKQDYKATLTYTGTLTNMDVYTSEEELTPATWTSANGQKVENPTESETKLFNEVNVAKAPEQGQTTKKLYVVLAVSAENSGSDASFEGTFEWKLAGVAAQA